MRVFIVVILSISLLFNSLNILCLTKLIILDEFQCFFVFHPLFFQEKEVPILWSEEGRPLSEKEPLERNEGELTYRVRAGPFVEA